MILNLIYRNLAIRSKSYYHLNHGLTTCRLTRIGLLDLRDLFYLMDLIAAYFHFYFDFVLHRPQMSGCHPLDSSLILEAPGPDRSWDCYPKTSVFRVEWCRFPSEFHVERLPQSPSFCADCGRWTGRRMPKDCDDIYIHNNRHSHSIGNMQVWLQ